MKSQFVRTLLAVLLIGVFVVPAEAQRRRGERARSTVEVNVNLPRVRVDLPRVRVIPNDRWYYGSGKREYISLGELRHVAPRAYRRALREHRRLHRDMREMHPRRARIVHEQRHRHQGWSHREFVLHERY